MNHDSNSINTKLDLRFDQETNIKNSRQYL
jgi:hypothetical protein